MTNLTANLQNTVNNALQEALGKNVSPQKTSILLWANDNPKYPNSFILKKEGKKYLGLVRKDKRGENYWSFREIRRKGSHSNPEKNPVMENQEQNYANHANPSKE